MDGCFSIYVQINMAVIKSSSWWSSTLITSTLFSQIYWATEGWPINTIYGTALICMLRLQNMCRLNLKPENNNTASTSLKASYQPSVKLRETLALVKLRKF